MKTTPLRHEYVVLNSVAPSTPCHVPNPDVVSECALSELPSSIHSDEETDHDPFFFQTCVEKVESAEYVTRQKLLISMRGVEPLEEGLDPLSKLREYVDSKRRVMVKSLCYARSTRHSWPLKQGPMGDISQLQEDLEQKITTWQQEGGLEAREHCVGCPLLKKKNSQKNSYVNPLERAYAVTDHQRRWRGTYCMPMKGCRTPLRMLSPLRTTCLPLSTKGQTTYSPTRTWRRRSNPWNREYRS